MHELLLLLRGLPVVDGSTGVSAVLDVNHQDGKPQEPHAHAEADAVHCLVAHEHLTVDIGLHARDRGAGPVFTEARDLQHTQEGFKRAGAEVHFMFGNTGPVTE